MSKDSEDNSDCLQLSADTMKALMEFYQEQEERELKRQEIAKGKIPEAFEEDWNMSQFWYTEETTQLLANECLRLVGKEEIACVSCPSIYRCIKKQEQNTKCKLFEFDTRFAVFREDFIFYDFKSPLDIPSEMRERFSLVIADPPYLSEDCLTKTSVTVKYLSKPDAKIILCTGSVMEDLAYKLLKVKPSSFVVKHHKQLSNPFVCYTNYNPNLNCELSL